MTCPICDGETQALFRIRGYDIRSCMGCEHRFAGLEMPSDHVERTYGDSYFFGGGAGYDDYIREGPLLVERGRFYARLLRHHRAPGRLLDVGAAAGFVLEGFLREGWEGEGVEPNRRMCALANERLGDLVQPGTLENWESQWMYDLVSMIQVVAHFQDPPRALRAAARLTAPGGFWLVETWDRASWTARLFGRRWHEYSPPSVLHFFSRASLVQLASDMGFRLVATGRPRKWLDAGHALSLLRHSLGLGGLKLGVPERLLPKQIRLPYPGDDIFWALFEDDRGQAT